MPLTPNYVAFVVSDLERSLDFYRLLGLPLAAGAHLNAEGEPEGHVEVTVGGLRLAWETEALVGQVYPGWTAPPRGQSRLSLALQADTPDEVDAACQRLRAHGYEVKAAPYDAFWGQRYATVVDPDGTSVDLFAWLNAPGS